MLHFVLWSFVVALMPVALGLVWGLISYVGNLIGSRLASPRGGQASRAFMSPPRLDPSLRSDSSARRRRARVQDDSCNQSAGDPPETQIRARPTGVTKDGPVARRDSQAVRALRRGASIL
jgi:hypothetical protein